MYLQSIVSITVGQIVILMIMYIIGQIVILMIMYINTFKTGGKNMLDVTLADNFQYQNQFLHMQAANCPNIFVDQGRFSDPDFISGTHQRENVQFTDN